VTERDPARHDPLALVNSLDVEEIRRQLEELDNQSRALRTLLRAALARRRQNDRVPKLESKG
jgi:hypothetical protein